MKMKNLYFDTIEELASDIFCEYEDLEGESKDITIIAKYEEARQLIKEFMCLDFNIVSISDLQDSEFNFYDKEYTIALTAINNEYELWCFPSYCESGYLYNEATITYVLDNCSSKILDYLDANTIYEVNLYDEEDCCECCAECDCSEHEESEHNAEVILSTDDGSHTVTIKCNLANEDVLEMLREMERMNSLFKEMDYFRRTLRI